MPELAPANENWWGFLLFYSANNIYYKAGSMTYFLMWHPASK
jgi:hypothetical protein